MRILEWHKPDAFYLYMVVCRHFELMGVETHERKSEPCRWVRNGGNLISKGNQMTRHSNPFAPPQKKGYIFYFLFSIFLDVKCYCRGKAFPLKLYTPTVPPTPFTNSFSCTTTSYHVVMWFVRSTIESGFEGNVPYSIIYLSCTHTTSSISTKPQTLSRMHQDQATFWVSISTIRDSSC